MVTGDGLSGWKERGLFTGAYCYLLTSLVILFLVIVMILGVSDTIGPGGVASSILDFS